MSDNNLTKPAEGMSRGEKIATAGKVAGVAATVLAIIASALGSKK